jgi:heme-degrading monooxygenase HmoA
VSHAFAQLPDPPYYAVIFSSQRREGDEGYAAMASAMFTLALQQPGCLGAESARGPDGVGITVAYFRDEAAIAAWKANYELRVAHVERAYAGPEGR